MFPAVLFPDHNCPKAVSQVLKVQLKKVIKFTMPLVENQCWGVRKQVKYYFIASFVCPEITISSFNNMIPAT